MPYKSALKVLLALCIVLQVPMGFAAEPNEPPGADALENSVPILNDAELDQLASEKARNMEAAPTWVKRLWSKKLRDYFPRAKHEDSELPREAVEQLADDSAKLNEYFEQQNPDADKNFSERKLKPFIRSLNPKKLFGAYRDGTLKVPLSEWTVEMMVVVRQVAAINKYPDYAKRLGSMLVGPRLYGASKMAALVVITAGLGYGAYLVGGKFLLGLTVGTLWGSLQAGPFAAILNSLSAWLLVPTTEFIRVINARYTGGLEQRYNAFLDKLKPKDLQENEAKAGDRNTQPRVANLERDGMNFAYMTREDQHRNWEKNLRMWVAVAKRFNQLLRDTHHHGRVLMMVSWSDEQNSAHFVETMDTKLVSLAIEAEVLMTPYKTAYLVRNDSEGMAEMMMAFDRFQELCDSTWMTLDIGDEAMERIGDEIDLAQAELMRMGVTERDMAMLKNIQAERAKAVGTIVTALTVNEIRSFSVAEANRNLEDEARGAQRVVRKGYQLQSYVEKYLPLVQELQRRMGYENNGHRVDRKNVNCEVLLGERRFHALPPK